MPGMSLAMYMTRWVGLDRQDIDRISATTEMCACSDKMARWCILGVEGALLQQFLEEPLHIDTLTAACTTASAKQNMTQALSALKQAILGEPLPQ